MIDCRLKRISMKYIPTKPIAIAIENTLTIDSIGKIKLIGSSVIKAILVSSK